MRNPTFQDTLGIAMDSRRGILDRLLPIPSSKIGTAACDVVALLHRTGDGAVSPGVDVFGADQVLLGAEAAAPDAYRAGGALKTSF